MKKWSKVLTILLCVILLVTASVLGTLALLIKKSGTVTNSFIVGDIDLTLDETAVDLNGEPIEGEPARTENEYKLFAGETYQKDPTVHVGAKSEDCYLFVKVENGIAGVESDTNTIASQIVANGWTKLDDGIYWRSYVSADTDTDYPVFTSFTIGDVELDALLACEDNTIAITAYAVQRTTEVNDVGTAWEAVSAVE